MVFGFYFVSFFSLTDLGYVIKSYKLSENRALLWSFILMILQMPIVQFDKYRFIISYSFMKNNIELWGYERSAKKRIFRSKVFFLIWKVNVWQELWNVKSRKWQKKDVLDKCFLYTLMNILHWINSFISSESIVNWVTWL